MQTELALKPIGAAAALLIAIILALRFTRQTWPSGCAKRRNASAHNVGPQDRTRTGDDWSRGMKEQGKRLEWERRTAPILRILKVALYAALTLIGLDALVWLIPRAWHALMLRLLAFRTGSPDMPLILAVVSRGLFRA